eukprot:8703145-Ditylum_brightwellii.AAC.1
MPSVMPSSMPSSEPSSMPSYLPSFTPTFEFCEMSSEDRRDAITEMLLSVSERNDLFMFGSPQYFALEWLLEFDSFHVCPDDPNCVQRYILAVFYFSTGGGTWDECNAPTDFSDSVNIAQANVGCTILADGFDVFHLPIVLGSDAWLSPTNECNWGGMACSQDSLSVDRIEFENDGLSGSFPFELGNLTELRYLIVEDGTTS